jgi:hypothetical protein
MKQSSAAVASIWNRYGIASTAFEASVQRLGFADASLFGVLATSLAAMGFFAATQSWVAATGLLAPVMLAWVGIARQGRGRSQREIAALAFEIADEEVGRSVRALVVSYRANERAYGFKTRLVRLSGAAFLCIISAGILAPLAVLSWGLLRKVVV